MSSKQPFRQPYIKPPYIPPFKQEINREEFKFDNSNLIEKMTSIINSLDIPEIINFFHTNIFGKFVDKDGNTPIHLIVKLDDSQINEEQKINLIEQLSVSPINIPIDSYNKQNETPLHIAIQKQFPLVVKSLIEKKADVNKLNHNNQNALHLALTTNIRPCDVQRKSNSITSIETKDVDKNEIYIELQNFFIENRSIVLSDKINEIVRYFYKLNDYYKYTADIEIKGENVIKLNTEVEKSILDGKNAIQENLLQTTLNTVDITKKIDYQIKNTLSMINREYKKFTEKGIKELNLDTKYLKLDETDLSEIANSVLLNTTSKFNNIYELIEDYKQKVIGIIHKDMTNILTQLFSGFGDRIKYMNTCNFINPISLIEYKNVLSYDKINNLTENVRGILHNLFSSKLFTTNIISIQDIIDYYNLLTLGQSNELFTTTSYDYLILANTSSNTRSIDTSYDLVSQIEEQYDYVDIIVSRLLVLDPSIDREILKDLYSNFNCHTFLILSIIDLISKIKEEVDKEISYSANIKIAIIDDEKYIYSLYQPLNKINLDININRIVSFATMSRKDNSRNKLNSLPAIGIICGILCLTCADDEDEIKKLIKNINETETIPNDLDKIINEDYIKILQYNITKYKTFSIDTLKFQTIDNYHIYKYIKDLEGLYKDKYNYNLIRQDINTNIYWYDTLLNYCKVLLRIKLDKVLLNILLMIKILLNTFKFIVMDFLTNLINLPDIFIDELNEVRGGAAQEPRKILYINIFQTILDELCNKVIFNPEDFDSVLDFKYLIDAGINKILAYIDLIDYSYLHYIRNHIFQYGNIIMAFTSCLYLEKSIVHYITNDTSELDNNIELNKLTRELALLLDTTDLFNNLEEILDKYEKKEHNEPIDKQIIYIKQCLFYREKLYDILESVFNSFVSNDKMDKLLEFISYFKIILNKMIIDKSKIHEQLDENIELKTDIEFSILYSLLSTINDFEEKIQKLYKKLYRVYTEQLYFSLKDIDKDGKFQSKPNFNDILVYLNIFILLLNKLQNNEDINIDNLKMVVASIINLNNSSVYEILCINTGMQFKYFQFIREIDLTSIKLNNLDIDGEFEIIQNIKSEHIQGKKNDYLDLIDKYTAYLQLLQVNCIIDFEIVKFSFINIHNLFLLGDNYIERVYNIVLAYVENEKIQKINTINGDNLIEKKYLYILALMCYEMELFIQQILDHCVKFVDRYRDIPVNEDYALILDDSFNSREIHIDNLDDNQNLIRINQMFLRNHELLHFSFIKTKQRNIEHLLMMQYNEEVYKKRIEILYRRDYQVYRDIYDKTEITQLTLEEKQNTLYTITDLLAITISSSIALGYNVIETALCACIAVICFYHDDKNYVKYVEIIIKAILAVNNYTISDINYINYNDNIYNLIYNVLNYFMKPNLNFDLFSIQLNKTDNIDYKFYIECDMTSILDYYRYIYATYKFCNKLTEKQDDITNNNFFKKCNELILQKTDKYEDSLKFVYKLFLENDIETIDNINFKKLAYNLPHLLIQPDEYNITNIKEIPEDIPKIENKQKLIDYYINLTIDNLFGTPDNINTAEIYRKLFNINRPLNHNIQELIRYRQLGNGRIIKLLDNKDEAYNIANIDLNYEDDDECFNKMISYLAQPKYEDNNKKIYKETKEIGYLLGLSAFYNGTKLGFYYEGLLAIYHNEDDLDKRLEELQKKSSDKTYLKKLNVKFNNTKRLDKSQIYTMAKSLHYPVYGLDDKEIIAIASSRCVIQVINYLENTDETDMFLMHKKILMCCILNCLYYTTSVVDTAYIHLKGKERTTLYYSKLIDNMKDGDNTVKNFLTDKNYRFISYALFVAIYIYDGKKTIITDINVLPQNQKNKRIEASDISKIIEDNRIDKEENRVEKIINGVIDVLQKDWYWNTNYNIFALAHSIKLGFLLVNYKKQIKENKSLYAKLNLLSLYGISNKKIDDYINKPPIDLDDREIKDVNFNNKKLQDVFDKFNMEQKYDPDKAYIDDTVVIYKPEKPIISHYMNLLYGYFDIEEHIFIDKYVQLFDFNDNFYNIKYITKENIKKIIDYLIKISSTKIQVDKEKLIDLIYIVHFNFIDSRNEQSKLNKYIPMPKIYFNTLFFENTERDNDEIDNSIIKNAHRLLDVCYNTIMHFGIPGNESLLQDKMINYNIIELLLLSGINIDFDCNNLCHVVARRLKLDDTDKSDLYNIVRLSQILAPHGSNRSDDDFQFSNLNQKNNSEDKIIDELNKILTKHIKNLNLLISLNNIQINKNNLLNINEINNIITNPLCLFLLGKNESKCSILFDRNIEEQQNKCIDYYIEENNKKDSVFIPNSFNDDEKEIDYVYIVKLRFIKWFIDYLNYKQGLQKIINSFLVQLGYNKNIIDANDIFRVVFDGENEKDLINKYKYNNYFNYLVRYCLKQLKKNKTLKEIKNELNKGIFVLKNGGTITYKEIEVFKEICYIDDELKDTTIGLLYKYYSTDKLYLEINLNNINEYIINLLNGNILNSQELETEAKAKPEPEPEPPEESLYDKIKKTLTKKFKKFKITEQTIIMLIIRLLDTFFINCMDKLIYIKSIEDIQKNIRELIRNKTITEKYDKQIKQILDTLNKNFKLDKLIGERKQIVSDVKTIKEDGQEKNIIVLMEGNNKYSTYYPKDYTSLSLITTRLCMYNMTNIIDSIINKSINFFKLDSKGYFPLYYAINSYNYVLLETIFKKLGGKSKSVIEYKDMYKKSSLDYANAGFEYMRSHYPDYNKLYKTHLKKLLSSATIVNSIPLNYEELCTKTLVKKIEKFGSNFTKLEEKKIDDFKKIVNKFEERYEKKQQDIKYYKNLIFMGNIVIINLFDYYYDILIELKKFVKDFEDDFYKIIQSYVDKNKETIVRLYYMIKKDDDDILQEDATPIEDFLVQLLEELVLNGVIVIDSSLYKTIKQFINGYMNELISKTLDYVKIMLDVYHRWVVNYYNSKKTLQIINAYSN